MKDWKNTLYRAARTFVQAALGYAAANVAGVINADGDGMKAALGGLILSAVAAGIAALMNLPERESEIEHIEGAAVVKKAVVSVDELPLAGQEDIGDE